MKSKIFKSLETLEYQSTALLLFVFYLPLLMWLGIRVCCVETEAWILRKRLGIR